ncbi:glycosyltransferase family 87 protein [Halorientalis pallida]|uniref:glycosyltransferase family 87 protein n=1 Tax=Halorientalis pallida TaxID=2479928 RepID=UPI003C6F85E0
MPRERPGGPRWLARCVLGVGILLGFGYLCYRTAVTPDGLALDFEIYRAAAADLWNGEPVYGSSPIGVPGLTYRYPPLLLLWFSLFLGLPPALGFVLHTAVALCLGGVLGWVSIRRIERYGPDLSRLDRGLIVGFVAASPIGAPSLFFGNVNHYIAVAMGLGLVWLDDGKQSRAGVALALAALPKVFPAAVGIWLLWRRAWRAVAAAVTTGVGCLVAGAVLFGPARTRNYVTSELLPRSAPDVFAGGLPPSSVYVSLRRPLSVVAPRATALELTVGAVLLVTPVLYYTYTRSRGPVDRMVALLATLSAVLLVVPSYSMYFLLLFYPLIPLLYLLDRPESTVFAAGTALLTLTLKLDDVVQLLEFAGLPDPARATVLAGARAIYTLGTPVLWGTLCLLLAGIWRLHGRHRHSGEATERASGERWSPRED